jgi:hypothetical protein
LHFSPSIVRIVGFEVLTAVSMKIAVFWVVAPCSLVEVYSRSEVLRNSLLSNFLHHPLTSCPLGTSILLSANVSNVIIVCCFLLVKDHVPNHIR